MSEWVNLHAILDVHAYGKEIFRTPEALEDHIRAALEQPACRFAGSEGCAQIDVRTYKSFVDYDYNPDTKERKPRYHEASVVVRGNLRDTDVCLQLETLHVVCSVLKHDVGAVDIVSLSML